MREPDTTPTALSAEATVRIEAPPEAVFDYSVSPDNMVRSFRGRGPVPAIEQVEILDGETLRAGVMRRVKSSDGSVIDEEVVALDRPELHAYRLLRGFRPPLAWLARRGDGRWTFTPTDSGTEVHWRLTFELTSSLAWPIARLTVRPFLQAAMRDCLHRIRAAVEG